MKQKLMSPKLLVPACVIAAIILLVLLIPLLVRGEEREPLPRREYTAKTGDIVVGIDATGTISSEKYSQFLKTIVQIQEYRVKVGDFVRKGDILAALSPEDLTKRLKEANEAFKNDSFAVKKAIDEKENYRLEQEKKINDIRAAGEAAYQEKAGLLLSKKATAEQTIAEQKAQIETLHTTITNHETDKAARPNKILELTNAISALQSEITALKQKIDTLTADTATDHSAEIAELTQKVIENELAVTDKTREKTQWETTDYDALITAAKTQITQSESTIATLQTELTALAGSLSVIDEQRAKDRAAEEESIALLNKQSQAQYAVYDNQISQAQSKAADAKQLRDEVQALQTNPNIIAEQDGVILKLGYSPNAVTDATTPVVEIGQDGEKNLLLQVDPMDIADVEAGQEVSFYVDAYPDQTFSGKVVSKSHLQGESGKFEVTVALGETDQPLLDGMGANATLIVKQKLNVLTLSNKAIFYEDGKSFVWMADDDGNLQKKEITAGFSNGRLTEITSGLADGDTVFVEERYEDS